MFCFSSDFLSDCNGVSYDPIKAKCCGGVLSYSTIYDLNQPSSIPISSLADCCVTTAFNNYYARCCDGVVSYVSTGSFDALYDAGCCGKTAYYMYDDGAVCCDGVMVSGYTCPTGT